jgi:hypothetical protein
VSRYDNDPRVTRRGSGYTVQLNGQAVHVLDADMLGWGAYTGPNLDLLFTATGPLLGAASADELIGALLQADNAA